MWKIAYSFSSVCMTRSHLLLKATSVMLERGEQTGMPWTMISHKHSTKKRDLWFWSNMIFSRCAKKATARQTWWERAPAFFLCFQKKKEKHNTAHLIAVLSSFGDSSCRRHGASRRSRGWRYKGCQDSKLLHRLLPTDIYLRCKKPPPPTNRGTASIIKTLSSLPARRTSSLPPSWKSTTPARRVTKWWWSTTGGSTGWS